MSWSSPIKHRGDGAALRAAVLLALAAVTAAVILVAVVFVAVVLVPGWSAAWALADKPRVIAVHTGPQSQVSMVVEAQSNPSGRDLSSDDVSVTIGGRRVPTTVTPVASSSLSVAIVIDAASGTTPQMLEAVQSGATEFLLRLPAGAHTMVVTAGDDPRVAAPLNPAPADALTAIATIQPDGARATAAGALLAAQELASAPAGPREIVIFAGGGDEHPPSIERLGRQIAQVGAIPYILQTGDDDYWVRLVDRTGGAVLPIGAERILTAYQRLATSLDDHYVVAFQSPIGLPAVAAVETKTGDTMSRTVVTLPDPDVSDQAGGPSGSRGAPGSESGLTAVALLGLAVAALAVVALQLRRRRHQTASYPDRPLPAGSDPDR